MSYVQNAGHRAISTWTRGHQYEMILDLGCGDGHHFAYWDSRNTIIGVDLDQISLEAAKARYPSVPVVRGDACFLPIVDSSADCIICIYSLEHLIYLDAAIEEIVRVLKPGGDIFISVPTEGSFAWSMGRSVTTARRFSTASLDYHRAQEIDHINCIWQLDRAIRRHLIVERRILFPLRLPVFHLNLVVTYHCRGRQRPDAKR